MLIAALTQYSRNNVWRELVLDKGDAVAQQQFALFQALHLDEVRSRRLLQRHNRGIEVAMLLLQARKQRPKLAFFLFCHRRLRSRLNAVSAPKFLWIIAFWLMSGKPACCSLMAE